MSNPMQNLIGIMSRRTDDSQDMPRRQVAEQINRVETSPNVENKEERNIVHSTPYQIRDAALRVPELAQSIQKLTRKAYPSANLDVTETLALYYFVDAIPFKDIRIRLREVSPKTVAEAENIAVRLDAVHMADRSRNCNVKVIGVDTKTNDLSTKIDEVIKKTDRVSNEVETLKSKDTRSQEFKGNNRNYGLEPRVQGSWSKFNKGNNFHRNGGTNNQYIPRGQANGSNGYDQKPNSNHGNWQSKIKDNGILGMDFLTKNKCDLMLSKGYMMLYKERIPCFSIYGDKQNTCCRISLYDNVVIPPESELMASGKTVDGIPMNLSGIVEPDKNFIEKNWDINSEGSCKSE
ncbi:unnamed protein product [Mytilus coruscus]|uniref:Uncharacterized protein n=1 Tax=Mytilus coruscus TaxID=42192 RepID=A0A6J8DGI0_MYTCO|nr:unnamed protein product [Mytilus coruscus]